MRDQPRLVAVASAAVRDDVLEDRFDPGQELRHGLALELVKTPPGTQVDLLNDVGAVQPRVQLPTEQALGALAHPAAQPRKQGPKGRFVASLGFGQETGEVFVVVHGDPQRATRQGRRRSRPQQNRRKPEPKRYKPARFLPRVAARPDPGKGQTERRSRSPVQRAGPAAIRGDAAQDGHRPRTPVQSVGYTSAGNYPPFAPRKEL